ncbi:hypothetical protein E3V33_06125, partial [Candidatus Marinimicrobia bacterium MT.SAG.4]
MWNPSGLGFNNGSGFNIAQTHFSRDLFRDTGLYFAGDGFGYSVEWIDGVDSRIKQTFATGFRGDDLFSFGFAYSWFKSADRRYKALNVRTVGFTSRPWKFLSMAGKWNSTRGTNFAIFVSEFDTTKPQDNYRIGIGLRPFGNNITITTDLNVDKKSANDVSTLIYGLEIWSNKGLSINAMYDELGNYEFGIEVGFPTKSLRNSNSFDKDGEYLSSTVMLESREHFRETNLHTKGKYLKLNLKGAIPDSPQRGYFFSRGPRTTAEWVRLIEKARV